MLSVKYRRGEPVCSPFMFKVVLKMANMWFKAITTH